MRKLILVASLILVVPPAAVAADEITPSPVTAGSPDDTTAGQTPNATRPATSTTDLLIHALSMIGVKYKYGGNSAEGGFDCSGFVRHVFQEATGLELPRNSFGMSKLGDIIDASELVPGDLLFYNTLRRRFSHVAIYIGEGRFVHAPSRGKSVEIVDMNDRYWKKRFNGARRLLQPATD